MHKFSIKHKQKPNDTYLSEIKGWGFWGEKKVGRLVLGVGLGVFCLFSCGGFSVCLFWDSLLLFVCF